MALVVPKVGALADLEFKRNNFLPGSVLRLFQNDYSPTINSVLADFVEATFSGYAGQTIVWSNAAFTNLNGVAQVDATPLTFSQNGGPVTQIVFGYYVRLVGGGLAWAERFASPVFFSGSGVGAVITPSITYHSEFTS